MEIFMIQRKIKELLNYNNIDLEFERVIRSVVLQINTIGV